MRNFIEGGLFWIALVLLAGEPNNTQVMTWLITKTVAIGLLIGIAMLETPSMTKRKSKKRPKMKHYVHNHNSDYGC